MIRAVVFDWGDVIATFDNEIFIQYLASYTSKSSFLNKLNKEVRVIFQEKNLRKFTLKFLPQFLKHWRFIDY